MPRRRRKNTNISLRFGAPPPPPPLPHSRAPRRRSLWTDDWIQVECAQCEGKGFFVSASAMPKKCRYCSGLGTFGCQECSERRLAFVRGVDSYGVLRQMVLFFFGILLSGPTPLAVAAPCGAAGAAVAAHTQAGPGRVVAAAEPGDYWFDVTHDSFVEQSVGGLFRSSQSFYFFQFQMIPTYVRTYLPTFSPTIHPDENLRVFVIFLFMLLFAPPRPPRGRPSLPPIVPAVVSGLAARRHPSPPKLRPKSITSERTRQPVSPHYFVGLYLCQARRCLLETRGRFLDRPDACSDPRCLLVTPDSRKLKAPTFKRAASSILVVYLVTAHDGDACFSTQLLKTQNSKKLYYILKCI